MGYYIDNKGNRVELFGEKLDLQDKNLVELVLPKNCKYCDCSINLLTSLIINENCTQIDCAFNNLTSIVIPKGCIYGDCSFNSINNILFLGKSENIKIEIGIDFNDFNSNIISLYNMDKSLLYKIFELPECKLRMMLLSSDEETFNLGLEILKNKFAIIKNPWDII